MVLKYFPKVKFSSVCLPLLFSGYHTDTSAIQMGFCEPVELGMVTWNAVAFRMSFCCSLLRARMMG